MLFEADHTSEAVIAHRNAVWLMAGNARIELVHVDMLIADGQLTLAKEQLDSIKPKIHPQNSRAIRRVIELEARLNHEAAFSVEASEL